MTARMANGGGYCDTVGIDLGTTRSSVAVWDGTQVHVIANESGENTTPSWVCYTSKTQRRVGKAAERAASKYITSTVYHAKRLIGRPYNDSMQAERAALNWPFKVVDQGGNAGMEVTCGEDKMVVSPEEVGAAVLSYLKRVAEDFIGRPVHKAVITVPAYFSDSQRQATRDAGQIADLEVVRILNEPTAAALAFGVLRPDVEDSEGEGEEVERRKHKNLLVFDFGGGTFDVTIMQIDGESFKVRSTDGDVLLGGEDIDGLLVSHFAAIFELQHKIDLYGLNDEKKKCKAFKKLTQACSQLKVDLSRMPSSDFCIDDLIDGLTFEASLDREEFDHLAGPLLQKIRSPIERALQKVHGGMRSVDIDQVLLVGGSSRIPMVQDLLHDMFPGTEICRRINPDEAVVIGAAIEASRSVDMIDIVPRPLSIATANHADRTRSFATPIVAACTPIPEGGITITECFANSRDNQDCVTIRICEGEAEFFDDNLRLGVFEITDIPPRPRGQVTIKVTMCVDSDGILSVGAVVEQTGQEMQAKVTSNKGRMSAAQVKQKQLENRAFEKEAAGS